MVYSVENLSGPTSPSGIKPEDLTDDVFSYIFLAKDLPTGTSSAIPEILLKSMREVRFFFLHVCMHVFVFNLLYRQFLDKLIRF